MQIINGLEQYRKSERPLFLALGNFDGVHHGHSRLIKGLVDEAHNYGAVSAAFIFEPHPSRVLNPERAPKLLVTAERKAELLENLGLELLIYHPFTMEMARTSPREFVEKLLVNIMGVKHIAVGFNYTFGHKGSGTAEMLQEMGREYGFTVQIVPAVELDGEVVSSSLIRSYLENGAIESAGKLLGYYPMIEGIVVEGEKRGFTIGFPTANLAVPADLSIPSRGVYAARAEIDGQLYKAAVNIGNKPTFHADYPICVEAHLIDFEGNLYGRQVRLFFLHKIRDEKKFNGAEELMAQIARDRQSVIDGDQQ
ncbi:bifunctional riboflavin kinase/FAD synthetase [Syntrophomonas palmitatica]|uniref:bifunctional riboflavin kinase/FAD synthetase n=1 Tax=Syntrophomonas palmitatica TaxID=402877 RepID=UPI0006D0CDE9|nr:bifunctional riboflavin kinase/FAD synthetase [Syntrophomonas palmitatica]